MTGQHHLKCYLVDLNPELQVLPEPHHVCGVAGPPDHPHPHPGRGGRVGHHVGASRLEWDPAIHHLNINNWPPPPPQPPQSGLCSLALKFDE